ncbi:MAG: hypothetical protein ACYDH1_05290 [Anaerolineaceae bacterium]
METNSDIKACRYCGKELPQEAIFCYYCKRELVTRPERPAIEEKTIKIPWWLWVLAVVVIGILIILIF